MLTKKFNELYNLVGISLGSKKTPIQYSFDHLNDLRRDKLRAFYVYNYRISKESMHTLNSILDNCFDSYQVYIWLTTYNEIKRTIHGYTVLDKHNNYVCSGVVKGSLDAKIVQFCTQQLTNLKGEL